jgi:hypothetical protein
LQVKCDSITNIIILKFGKSRTIIVALSPSPLPGGERVKMSGTGVSDVSDVTDVSDDDFLFFLIFAVFCCVWSLA